MAEIVVFHSVFGVRPGLVEMAERWRAEGHVVHVPDLFDGRVFDDPAIAFGYVEQLGYLPGLIPRADAALADLGKDVVYAGFSMGTALVSHAVISRPGARGALIFHGGTPISEVGGDVWPSSVPVQSHEAELDPYREPEINAQFAESVSASGAAYTHFSYPDIAGHLFADPSLPDEYDAEAAALLNERVSAFLTQVS